MTAPRIGRSKVWATALCAGILSVAATVPAVADKRAPVEELGVSSASNGVTAKQPANQAQLESYYQMQVLQEEVRQLRGLVEELGYELQQLKQRQMDDYLDLDRRLSGAVANTSSAPAANAAPAPAATTPVGNVAASDAERNDYSAAYQLLRNKQLKESGQAFQKYIDNYPNGKYVANAYYWLGEVELINGDQEKARQAFEMVVNNYPTNRKAPDAAFKLGKVYHQQGNKAKAKDLLDKVAQGNSKAARLAQQYLADYF